MNNVASDLHAYNMLHDAWHYTRAELSYMDTARPCSQRTPGQSHISTDEFHPFSLAQLVCNKALVSEGLD